MFTLCLSDSRSLPLRLIPQVDCAPARGTVPREDAMLTKKQSELLRFINERLKETGVPPSFDEMKDALDLRSKSGIHRLIMALEERGFIRRLPNRARALEVQVARGERELVDLDLVDDAHGFPRPDGHRGGRGP